jgi:hypothetical protein
MLFAKYPFIPNLPTNTAFLAQLAYFHAMANELSLGDAISQFLSRSKLKSGVQAARIQDVWKDIMGVTIAKYTEKIQIINHTLFITTTIGPLKQELLYQKPLIIQRVNEVLGEGTIREVVIN